MRPLVKFAVTAAVVAAILFTAAALYLALVFDANRYKPELAAAARQATGRELAIDGDLALGLFPQPHVRLGAARLLNPQGFDGAVVEFTSARANVQLLPLLRRQIQIDELAVDGLRLKLLKNRKGEDNWSDSRTEVRIRTTVNRSEFRFTAFGFPPVLFRTAMSRRKTKCHCPKSN